MIEASKNIKIPEEEKFFRRLLNPFFQDFISYIGSAIYIKDNNTKKDALHKGILTIAQALMQRKLEIVVRYIPYIFDEFLQLETELQNLVQPYIQKAINFYKDNFKDTLDKKQFSIQSAFDKLLNKGLKEDESYTLKELLQTSGLNYLA